MAVTFTPNIGLAKPDLTELAKEWATNTKLCEDNNLILIDKTNLPLTSYNPTMVGSSTNPNVGVGSLIGEYTVFQGFVWGNFVINFLNPGVASGSGAGAYGISLPFAADTSFHNVGTSLSDIPGVASCIGEAHFITFVVNSGGTAVLDIVVVGGVTYARIVTETFPGKTAPYFTPGMPFNFANGDHITGQFFYKKA
ncbi:MAG: hypothetical protein HMLIMOIP_002085 [Candidatus Nitrosomirales archaeon]|jgi:hypothetical protein